MKQQYKIFIPTDAKFLLLEPYSNKKRIPITIAIIQHCSGDSGQCNKTRKNINFKYWKKDKEM